MISIRKVCTLCAAAAVITLLPLSVYAQGTTTSTSTSKMGTMSGNKMGTRTASGKHRRSRRHRSRMSRSGMTTRNRRMNRSTMNRDNMNSGTLDSGVDPATDTAARRATGRTRTNGNNRPNGKRGGNNVPTTPTVNDQPGPGK